MADDNKNPDLTTEQLFIEVGDSGLKRYSGTITEEFLRELDGQRGIELLVEMRDNHPIVGALLHGVTSLVRGVEWYVESANDTPEEKEKAEFISQCMHDMSTSWLDTLSEILSFLWAGYSFHELVYKQRKGPEQKESKYRSKYKDNKIGWRKISLRAQDTLLRWELDSNGGVKGFWQQVLTSDAGGNYLRYIPIEKALLFRTINYKNNPQGRSILRNAVVPYLRQRVIQDFESIGVERDLVGVPVIYAPAKIMSPSADANERMTLARLTSLVKKLRINDQSGVVLPSDCDDKGNPKYKFELVTAGGSKQFDTDKIITRYDQRIAMVVLADFIMLGHDATGSFALSDNKTDLFAVALTSYLDHICEVFNRYAISRLLELNGWSIENTPMLKHGEVDTRDVNEIIDGIVKLTQAGANMFPDPAMEQWVRDLLGAPAPSEDGMLDLTSGQDTSTEEDTTESNQDPKDEQTQNQIEEDEDADVEDSEGKEE